MHLLDDADWFQDWNVDRAEGLTTDIVSTENPGLRYTSTPKTLAPNIQLLETGQKSQQDPFRVVEDTYSTISEDHAEGQNAKLDACLRLLSEDEFTFLLPSDELDDDEIHVVETAVDPSRRNIALQDYQMQLMLLEQQNKKRLTMARMEQGQDYQTQIMLLEQQNRKRMMVARLEQGQDPQRQLQDLERMNKERLMPPRLEQESYQMLTSNIENVRYTGPPALHPIVRNRDSEAGAYASTLIDESDLPGQGGKRRKHDHARQNDHNSFLDGIHPNGKQPENGQKSPPLAKILYKISCSDDHLRTHSVPAFHDTPFVEASKEGRAHLNGRVPVYDLSSFMENDTDGIAFLIVRVVECTGASVLMARDGGLLRWTEEIYVKSKALKIAIKQAATCYYQTPVGQASNPTKFPTHPPSYTNHTVLLSLQQNQIIPSDLFLFHHRHALRAYGLQHPESEDHVNGLLLYAEAHHGATHAEAETLFTRGLVDKTHALLLFKPNDVLLAGTYGQPAAFVLQEWPTLTSDGWITLICWSFQTDGEVFVRKLVSLSLPPFGSDSVEIRSLAAYPLRFAAPEILASVLERGRKHWQLRVPTHVTYKGWNVKRDQFYPDARFMIDHATYRKMHENARVFHFDRPAITHPFDNMSAKLSVDQEPSETDLLLMPPDVHGFYFNEKKWIKLFVDCVHPVSWNTKAYERLVLPAPTKDLIQALVTVRMGQKGIKQGIGLAGKRTDITNGKGNGLIMLLHGGPGTGKTLTGESVAEIAEMPLYRVTCGDVGTSAEAVEKYLNTVLHLGKIWNCVLLLDEADIFLEERSMSDLQRNSIVSVFLRILEYYDGILLLTSNRVGLFDEAFKSRIQVALHYENLNRSARKKIWQNFLDMLEEDEEDVNFDEIKFHLDELAGKELNGRQIRNVLTTARQLAIYRKQRLDWAHLEQALAVSSDFGEYLKRVQGHTDDQRMRDEHLR